MEETELIKSTMSEKFIENEINIKEVLKNTPFNTCLLENNVKQIKDYCDFLANNKQVLLVNGYCGTGKTELTNFLLTNVSDKCFILKYTCFETSTLDDMLLSFFETFRKYTILGKFTPPRMKAENFTQKINSYFNSIF